MPVALGAFRLFLTLGPRPLLQVSGPDPTSLLAAGFGHAADGIKTTAAGGVAPIDVNAIGVTGQRADSPKSVGSVYSELEVVVVEGIAEARGGLCTPRMTPECTSREASAATAPQLAVPRLAAAADIMTTPRPTEMAAGLPSGALELGGAETATVTDVAAEPSAGEVVAEPSAVEVGAEEGRAAEEGQLAAKEAKGRRGAAAAAAAESPLSLNVRLKPSDTLNSLATCETGATNETTWATDDMADLVPCVHASRGQEALKTGGVDMGTFDIEAELATVRALRLGLGAKAEAAAEGAPSAARSGDEPPAHSRKRKSIESPPAELP